MRAIILSSQESKQLSNRFIHKQGQSSWTVKSSVGGHGAQQTAFEARACLLPLLLFLFLLSLLLLLPPQFATKISHFADTTGSEAMELDSHGGKILSHKQN